MSEERIEQLKRPVQRTRMGLVVMALGLVVAAAGVAWDWFGPRSADTCGECVSQCVERDAERASDNGDADSWDKSAARRTCRTYCRPAKACREEDAAREREWENDMPEPERCPWCVPYD
jgi:hypothetical protein